MGIEPEQYKALLTRVVGLLKRLETELVAYRMLVIVLKQVEPSYPYDDGLKTMLESPAIRKAMDEKYDGFLEAALKTIDERAASQALLAFLKDWTPEGPAN